MRVRMGLLTSRDWESRCPEHSEAQRQPWTWRNHPSRSTGGPTVGHKSLDQHAMWFDEVLSLTFLAIVFMTGLLVGSLP